MVRRFAGCLALLTFAVCIVAGLSAGNTAATVLSNALAAMGASFVVGLAVGAMAQKMLDENVAAAAARKAEPAPPKENLENPERIPEPRGR
jgi:threonine/homoserine/homoserine lactone efflux protein